MTPDCDLCQQEPGIYHVVLSPKHGEKDEEVTISAYAARSCLACAQQPVHKWHGVMGRLRATDQTCLAKSEAACSDDSAAS